MFSFACLSCSRSFCLSSPKVLLPFQGALADFWFSLVAAAILLTPRHYHWAWFSFRGFVCACTFYFAVFLTYTCDIRDFSLLVFSVSCGVGADVSAVSSDSFPPMCVCSLPGLLPGCCALALVDT